MKNIKLTVISLTIIFAIIGCGGSQSDGPVPVADTGPKGAVLSSFPSQPDPGARYLIYVHGAIIETGGMRPTHPTYGTYEYAAILQAFAARGFTVISEVRRAGADPQLDARRVADQVRNLIDRGVPPRHITVVGFSKGGGITALASAEVAHNEVAWVILAGCSQWIDMLPNAIPHGRVLSLVDDADDIAGSCGTFLSRMPDGSIHSETILDLGTGHGAFYRPDPTWLEPVIEWGGL